MILQQLLKFFRGARTTKQKSDSSEYMPFLWEDDYCQVEIVPAENREYIFRSFDQIESISSRSATEYGYTEIFMRGKMPAPTSLEELRVDYLCDLFKKYTLCEYEKISYCGEKIIDCKTSSTKAYGFPGATIFFEAGNEFINSLWLSIYNYVSAKHLDIICSALSDLGEDTEWILVDWNRNEVINLSDRGAIGHYLKSYLA